MKPVAFEYHRPRTLDEALHLAAELDDAKLLAGGQSLMPMMNFRFVVPDHVIDLNSVPELTGIRESGSRLVIGAMTRQRDIERSALVQEKAPLIPEAYQQVSHRQIRNRGTLGGSLCHLDPASEQPCFLAAQGADMVVRSLRGERRVAMADWTEGYMTPSLEQDEVLSAIEIDVWPSGHGYSFTEYSRRQGDYAIVGVAVLATCDAQRRFRKLAIALCGVAAGPVRLHDLERSLEGQLADEAAVLAAAQAAGAVDAMSDAHVTSDYRCHLAGVLTRRALDSAMRRMQGALA